MSQKRQVNQALLVGLDEKSFLGKVLTTTDEEIENAFRNLVPDASESEIAAGSVGQLDPLEKALFAQALIANAESEKIVNEFNASTKTESFSDLSFKEILNRRNKAAVEAEKFSRDADRYQKIAWASVNSRYPKTDNTGSFSFDKDGKIYPSQPDSTSEEYPICKGCGKRHAPGANIVISIEELTSIGNTQTKKDEEVKA